jgi:hypothetical protein
MDINDLPGARVVKVEMKKIEYSESELMVQGYSSKQVWEAPK